MYLINIHNNGPLFVCRRHIVSVVVFLILHSSLFALHSQGQTRLTLDDCIALARKQSVDAAVDLGELKSAYWQWRSYKADLLPEVSFSATLPSYNKTAISRRMEVCRTSVMTT